MRALAQGLKRAGVCAGFFACCQAPPALGAASGNQLRVSSVLEMVVIPGVEKLEISTLKLSRNVRDWCAAESDRANENEPAANGVRTKAYAALTDAFRETAAAWGGVEFLRFGPLVTKGRRERFAFWPDPRGVMARQLRQVLAAKDPALLEPGALVMQSAAVQGLPALEYLIVSVAGTQKAGGALSAAEGDDQGYRCKLAVAVGGNLASLAHEIRQEWTKDGGYRQMMLDTGPDHRIYKTDTEAAADLVRSLLTGLQVIADAQAKPRTSGAAAVQSATPPEAEKTNGPFSRIAAESAYFAGATHALKALYDGLDMEASLAPDKHWMKGWAAGAWRAILQSGGVGGAAKGVPTRSTPSPRGVAGRINGLRQLIGREMANAAGIPIGFNELDGD